MTRLPDWPHFTVADLVRHSPDGRGETATRARLKRAIADGLVVVAGEVHALRGRNAVVYRLAHGITVDMVGDLIRAEDTR